MAQVCDFVYVLMIDRLERWSMVGQLSATFAASQGMEVDVPDPFEGRRDFDDWLVSPLDEAPVDRERHELEAALGIGR